MDGGLEEPVGEVVLGEFVVGDIESVASPTVGATGLGGDEPAAFEHVEPVLDGHVATQDFAVDGVPEPVGKDPKEDFGERCRVFGQPADLRLGHVQLAGVAQEEQQIGSGFAFFGVLVSVHLGQNLQGVGTKLDNTDKRSGVGILPVETEKRFATGLVQLVQCVLLRFGKPGKALVLEDGNRLHARRAACPDAAQQIKVAASGGADQRTAT
jgi:hypothetical protein